MRNNIKRSNGPFSRKGGLGTRFQDTVILTFTATAAADTFNFSISKLLPSLQTGGDTRTVVPLCATCEFLPASNTSSIAVQVRTGNAIAPGRMPSGVWKLLSDVNSTTVCMNYQALAKFAPIALYPVPADSI